MKGNLEGPRNSDFDEKRVEFGKSFEHIDYAIVPKTHPPMYLMHKYWARKPHNVVSEYVRVYSNPGEIVLDPFMGSGVTIIEALKLGRKAVGIDLDPMSAFIAKNTLTPINIDLFEKVFINIEKSVKEKITSLYKTKCVKCKSPNGIISHIIWKTNPSSMHGEEPLDVWYFCANDGKLMSKKFDEEDFEHLDKINHTEIKNWYPKEELIWNSRINVKKGTKISDLFTKRNLLALSILYGEIEKISDENIRSLLKFVFTGFVAKSSKLNFRNVGGSKSLGRGWAVRGYWIPKEHMEQNVWNDFEGQYLDVKKGKEESNRLLKNVNEASKFSDLLNDKNVFIKTSSVNELTKSIPENSIDYIFTDPPYGDSVPYLELDYLWSCWVKEKPDFENEIIISDSPVRDKKFENYERMLTQAFKEMFKVLKANHWLTVTFHNTDIKIYNSIIRAVIFAGFELDKILYQPPAKPSAKSLLAPYGSAIGDYYIRFRKPTAPRKLISEQDIDIIRFEKIVVESIKEIIAERGEPVTYNDILKTIYISLDKHGYLLVSNPERIENILKKYKDKEFVFIKNQGWWFKDPSKYFLDIIPLQDRVEEAIIQVLRRKYKVSFDEILQELFINFKNALTPDPPSVIRLLEEYAKRTSDGKWQIKENVKQREKEHSVMIGYLSLIGKKLGFKTWVGKREKGDIFDGQPLAKYSEVELMIPAISPEKRERIEMIDVLWIKNNEIKFSFEVEFTTGITEAIIRGSYLKEGVGKFFVIPEERERKLFEKINAPILKDRIKNWKFIFFRDLMKFFESAKRKKELSIEEFNEITKDLKPEREIQTTLIR